MNLPVPQHSAGNRARILFRLLIAAVAGALYAVLPSIAFGQSGEFARVGGLSWNLGSAYGMTISGNHAYARMGQLQIFDISNPTNLVPVANVSNVRSVALSGNYCYATGVGGLRVLDVSNPASPQQVGAWTNGGTYGSVAISSNYAYVVGSENAKDFSVIDISNPASPVKIAELNWLGSAGHIAVSGTYAYISKGFNFQVVNISNPSNPVLMGALYLSNWIGGITLSGNYAYVTMGYYGLQVIDINNPNNPVRVGGVDTEIGSLALSGNHAYCSDTYDGLKVFDIANPLNPVLVGVATNHFGQTFGIGVSGNHAYLGGYSRIQIIDISSPTNPVTIGISITLSYVWSVAQSGNYAYLADQFTGLHVINVSNPTNPFRVGGHFDYTKPSYPFKIAVSGNYAYMLDYTNGLQVFSISNPASPVLLGTCAFFTNTPRRLALAGNYAYVTVDTNNVFVGVARAGMSIIDVSTPTNPTIVTTYWTTDNGAKWVRAGGVVVTNNYAYLTYGGQRWDPEFGDTSIGDVQVINVSNPSNPVFAGHVAPFWWYYEAWDIAVSGNYAYATYHHTPRLPPYNFEDGGLALVDISNPNNPFWVGFWPQSSPVEINTGEKHSQVVASGNNVWLLSDSYSPRVIDISNPTNMTIATTLSGGGFDLAVSGRYAYFASGPLGLEIYCRDCPLLTAELAGSQIMLKWPTNAVNFMVERAETVAAAQWQPQSGTPQVQGAFYTLFVPATNPAAFFRLRQF